MFEGLVENSFLLSLIAFALILIPAIIIHELGHFLAARMVGINVLEFGVGFPPRAVTLFRWKETDFTLNWLPIGGFVRPLGEGFVAPIEEADDIDEAELDANGERKQKNPEYFNEREELIARGVPEEQLQSVAETKPLPRIFFMAAGAIANVLSAIVFLFITALLGIPITQGIFLQVSEIGAGSAFDNEQIEIGDGIRQVNGEYLPNEQAFFEAVREADGEEILLEMRPPREFETYEVRLAIPVEDIQGRVYIIGVEEESPADTAGVLPDDLIIRVDGEALPPVNPLSELITRTQAKADQEMRLTILRDGVEREIIVVPENDEGLGRIGVAIENRYAFQSGTEYRLAGEVYEIIAQPIGASIQYGVGRTLQVLGAIAALPGEIIAGNVSGEEARPVSVVGISVIGGEFISASIQEQAPWRILEFIALISIFLGITNLLPFPPLDGGRIVFVVIEMVRGEPVSPKIEGMVYRIGLALILLLGIIIIAYDIINPPSLQ